MERLFGLFADEHRGEFRDRPENVHRLDLGGGFFSFGVAGHRRIGRDIVEPGPGHPVSGRVELEAEAGQDRKPEDAVDRGTG